MSRRSTTPTNTYEAGIADIVAHHLCAAGLAKPTVCALAEHIATHVAQRYPRARSIALANAPPVTSDEIQPAALYREAFAARRDAYRLAFKEQFGLQPHPLSDDDYTPIRFFEDMWLARARELGEMAITMAQLRGVDEPLFQAIYNYLRQAEKGVRGREKRSFEDIGVVSESYGRQGDVA